MRNLRTAEPSISVYALPASSSVICVKEIKGDLCKRIADVLSKIFVDFSKCRFLFRENPQKILFTVKFEAKVIQERTDSKHPAMLSLSHFSRPPKKVEFKAKKCGWRKTRASIYLHHPCMFVYSLLRAMSHSHLNSIVTILSSRCHRLKLCQLSLDG